MKPAIVVVDMLKDNIDTDSHFNMGEEGRKIIPPIRHLLSGARAQGIPVVFANDSFLADDFIFREGRMDPHAIAGTEGATVIAELEPQAGDTILEKRRFSGFLGTELAVILRGLGIDTIAVCGISTQVCVLVTALDGLANDFKAILLEDCCAAYRRQDHDAVTSLYRRGALYPMLKVMTADDFLAAVGAAGQLS